MDRNYDDAISFDELFLFLFPDHNDALARENKRLKVVGDRVKRIAGHPTLHGENVHHHESGVDLPVLLNSGSLFDLSDASAKKQLDSQEAPAAGSANNPTGKSEEAPQDLPKQPDSGGGESANGK